VDARAADVRLLRAYEPILRFTKGELFFPMAVAPYVAYCALWAGEADRDATCIVPAGAMSLGRLAEEGRAHQDRPLSLRFVRAPLRRAEYRRWRHAPRDHLSASGRFTTTGMFGRMVDAGFRASLLLRGTVAAGLAAAAEVAYREELGVDRFTYFGRIVRDGGYVCLQYWFFYAMNDWRSTFSGVNDHEADWELVNVYLAEQHEGPPRPAWVACSSHDHRGDNLRRRWDDPGLLRLGDHPIVFPGAGSHSGAFVSGDYVISVDPPRLRRPIALARRLQGVLAPWRDDVRSAAGFGIPFVDYARGDGKAIGPGQDAEWTAEPIDDDTPWVRDFRGLWGLDTEDPFGGERAPAGPRYERSGDLRASWANPLGWAGLLKVPPAEDEVRALLDTRVAALERELTELDDTIAAERSVLRGLGVQVRSLDSHDYARELADERRGEMHRREVVLNDLIAKRTRAAEEHRAHLATRDVPLAPEPPQAHITAPQAPRSEEQERRTRFLKVWGVISTPLLLASVIVILLGPALAWVITLALLIGIFTGVEAFARRRFLPFLASAVLLVGALAAGAGFIVLFQQHWRVALSVVLGAAALALLVGNVTDATHGWRRGSAADPPRP
jgi:hypothetical protein